MASDNPCQPELATKAREEGEVYSSSDDDQNPVCSAAPSANAVNPPASSRTTRVLPMNKFTLANRAGKANCSTNPARSANPNLQTSQQPNNKRSFEQNRVPQISANPGKYASSGADDSLVIRFFSDDESGSESEDGEDKALKTKSNATVVNDNGRLLSISSAKSSMSQQATRNASSIPKKSSMSLLFNSSMAKINGVANSKGASSSSVGQLYQVKKYNSIKRNLASQELGLEHGVDFNSTKVRDLRQQIALKAATQNKESASVSGKDYKSTNISSGAARKSNAAFFEAEQLTPEELDRKCLKVGDSYSKHLNSDVQQKMLATTFNLPSMEQILESSSLQDRKMGDCSQKERPTTGTKSSLVKWERQDCSWVDISSAKLPASNVNHNSRESDMSRVQVDPSVVLNQNQTPPLTNANTSTLPNKRKSVDSNLVKNRRTQPPACLLKTSTSRQILINSIEHLQGINGDKPSCQASLNLNPWNCLGTVNVAEHNSIDMQLVEMEDPLDKELDEAQEHRCKYEIEERNALKAYRKAQRALIEANSRCTELYSKRELYSAHFRSLIVNDSNLFLPSRQHEHVGTGVDCGNKGSRNVNLIPSSSDQMQPEYDGCNQPGYDSVTVAPTNLLYQHVNGHTLASEPFSEADASTSETVPCNSLIAANVVIFQSIDSNISADEDELTFPLDHETDQRSFKIQQRNQNSVGREIHAGCPNKNSSVDGPHDSLILEAKLRSKAQLPIRTFSKNGASSTVEPADEPGTEIDNRSERTQGSNGSMRLSETERSRL